AATYIGGSMNLVAVSNALEFENLGTIAAALASDNVVGTFYLISLSVMSGARFVTRSMGGSRAAKTVPTAEEETGESARPFSADIAVALAFSTAICAVATAVAEWIGVGQYAVL